MRLATFGLRADRPVVAYDQPWRFENIMGRPTCPLQQRGAMRKLGASFALSLGIASACSPPRIAGSQCSTRWQAPRALIAADGRPAYVESPTALPIREGMLLLGVPANFWAERDAFDPAPSDTRADTVAYFARLRANHGFIGFVLGPARTAAPVRPPHEGAMRRVVAARGGDGTIHVVWFAPSPDSGDVDAADRAVWYAERRANQWTVPSMLFAADRLDWSGQSASLVVRGSEVHILVTYGRTDGAGIAYIRRIAGRWRTTETRLRGLPSKATAQFIGSDSLAVAFAGIGAPDVRIPNGQHIYLVRVAVSDTLWPSPQRIQWSGLDAVRWPRLYRLPSASRKSRNLALIWGRMPRQEPGAVDTIYAMLSEDGGATWKVPQALPVPFGAETLTEAQDTEGNVHVVVTSLGLSRENAAMYHAVLRSGSWAPLTQIPAGPAASRPTVSSTGKDTLMLVWGEARPAGGGRPERVAPVSKYAFLVREGLPGVS